MGGLTWGLFIYAVMHNSHERYREKIIKELNNWQSTARKAASNSDDLSGQLTKAHEELKLLRESGKPTPIRVKKLPRRKVVRK